MSKPLILALRALGLGDFLVGVPAYRALRRAFPEHELRLATTAGVAPLAAMAGCIDSVAPARGPDDFARPARPVDIAVNLHGRGPQSTGALRALRPTQLICFDPVPPWDDAWPAHERQRWCHLLEAFGIAADTEDFRLRRPEIEPVVSDAVVVHPGAAYRSRRWPLGRFAAVARALAAAGHDVMLTGSRAEIPLATQVATRAGLPAAAVVAGQLDVVGLAALIANARLLVCGDTGPAHLATAYGTPSVVLFGPTPPHRWGPPADPRHVAVWRGIHSDDTGDPWAAATDPRLLAIEAAEVIAAALGLLDSLAARVEHQFGLDHALG